MSSTSRISSALVDAYMLALKDYDRGIFPPKQAAEFIIACLSPNYPVPHVGSPGPVYPGLGAPCRCAAQSRTVPCTLHRYRLDEDAKPGLGSTFRVMRLWLVHYGYLNADGSFPEELCESRSVP